MRCWPFVFALMLLAMTLAVAQDEPTPPVEPQTEPAQPPVPPQVAHAGDPDFVYDAERPAILYRDKVWLHLGDDSFSEQSDGASDLTRKSLGIQLRLAIRLGAAQLAALADPRWQRVAFKGSVIGNDTGRFECGPTVVTIGTQGKTIGQIVKSGSFVILLDKATVLEQLDRQRGVLELQIASGKAANSNDVDDQEIGRFQLVLEEEALPEPTTEPAPPPAEEPQR
jgi:hypothetical protein